MALGTGPALREVFGKRISGEDGYFDSFELAIFPKPIRYNASDKVYATPLVVFAFPSNWATYLPNYGAVFFGPETKPTTAAGEAAFFRINGIKSGVTACLLTGTITKNGSGGDMQFSDIGWPVGLPVTINNLYMRPPRLRM